MLEDQQWMQRFMTQKTQLMLERYKTVTEFLTHHGIPYFEMYVRVELSRRFRRDGALTYYQERRTIPLGRSSAFIRLEIGSPPFRL